MPKLSELIRQVRGKEPQGGSDSCGICGASAREREHYPAPGAVENCPPGFCRVCWYRLGRAIPERKTEHELKTLSDTGAKRHTANVEYGDW